MQKTKLVLFSSLIFSGAMAFAAPTDGDILATVHAANHAEEGSSAIIAKKSTNADVKAFAEKMMVDHGEVDNKLNAIAKDDGVKPTENMDSRKIEMKAAALKKELEMEDGAKLDKTFLTKQIAMHQDVLESLDKKLIPNAKNANLKKLLETVRSSVAEHIRLAQKALAKL